VGPKLFWKERLAMGIDESSEDDALLANLDASDWGSVLDAVGEADTWLRAAMPGDPRVDGIVAKLVTLASHPKWEIRRAVANVAAQALHSAFGVALTKLATDDNTRVRQAAVHAALRRRDWQNASTLGKQHEDRINSTLDDIEVRFGIRGREAVKRASEQVANTFSRELYHEAIGLITPLAAAADRLQRLLSDGETTRADLLHEAAQIGQRVAHLQAVLGAMRAYTAQPKITFAAEQLKEVIEEAAALVREGEPARKRQITIELQVDTAASVEISRSRFVQAMTNVLVNAIEAYDGLSVLKPIIVRTEVAERQVVISIQDSGCGMSSEVLADASVLFSTNKPNGTGFGLPLAIKIVESEHGGRLMLESIKGLGTTVRMILPTQQQRGRP
jgi:nitrogen fixation/metabolism regulation signal transduction histidine kinase